MVKGYSWETGQRMQGKEGQDWISPFPLWHYHLGHNMLHLIANIVADLPFPLKASFSQLILTVDIRLSHGNKWHACVCVCIYMHTYTCHLLSCENLIVAINTSSVSIYRTFQMSKIKILDTTYLAFCVLQDLWPSTHPAILKKRESKYFQWFCQPLYGC